MNSLLQMFDFFIEKRANSYIEILPRKDLFVTFLNPYTLFAMKEHCDIYNSFDYICSDAVFPVLIDRLHFIRSNRISFDLGSFAKPLFEYASIHRLSVYLLGTTEDNLTLATKKIYELYPDVTIIGKHNGFFENDEEMIAEVLRVQPDIIILGLGTPKQDLFLKKLYDSGFHGAAYTCGGFLHQTARSINGYYYPDFINKYNLRFAYRLLKEKYILQRIIIYYPKFFFDYFAYLYQKKKQS